MSDFQSFRNAIVGGDERQRVVVSIFAYLLFGFYFLLVLARAAQNPIVYDEAYMYMEYVRTGDVFNISIANNHLLNTLLVACFSFFHEFSEFFIRLPNILLLGILGIFLIRRVIQDFRYPLFFLIFFFYGCYAVFDFWGLARGYSTSLFFNTLGFVFLLDSGIRSRVKANFCFFAGVISCLSSLYIFSAFLVIFLYEIWRENHRIIPLHFLRDYRYLLLVAFNIGSLVFFYYWGRQITSMHDPLFAGESFFQGLHSSWNWFLPSSLGQYLVTGVALYSLVFAFKNKSRVRASFVLVFITLGLSLIPSLLAQIGLADRSDVFLRDRTLIPYWPLFCYPLLATLRKGNESSRILFRKSLVFSILSIALLFEFFAHLPWQPGMGWGVDSGVRELIARRGEYSFESKTCHNNPAAQFLFYIKKYNIKLNKCSD